MDTFRRTNTRDKAVPGSKERGLLGSSRGLILGALIVGFLLSVGCSSESYVQTVKVTAESVNGDGLFARVEYLQDGEVVSSIHLIDGNGDGVIDGKSGPSEEGSWPEGWEWFDSLYNDVVVGQTTMMFDGQKVVVTEGSDYEFIVGEYECRTLG
ncbi:MAG: hypothetical protein KAQ74_00895 [Dehalococcoidia bacterium]|nr:hypothetical protein [Dehalococcoidia bacterium]